SGFAKQNFETVKCDCSEISCPARLAHAARGRIVFDVSHSDCGGHLSGTQLVSAFGPPPNCADPRHQFTGVEWLRKVIVGSEFEADDPVHVLAACRQKQYRSPRAVAHAPEDLEAIHTRKHD